LTTYVNTQIEEFHRYAASRLGTYHVQYQDQKPQHQANQIVLGLRTYELSNHLGNVLVVISDKKLADDEAHVVSTTDYYPFGMNIQERTFQNKEYTFGFQGQFAEKDAETGLHYFELRLYDSKIVRWKSTDPYEQHASPYVAMGNNPIIYVDSDGGFDTRFGAWWYKIWNGGGDVSYNEDGDFWQVSQITQETIQINKEESYSVLGIEVITSGNKGWLFGAHDDKPVPQPIGKHPIVRIIKGAFTVVGTAIKFVQPEGAIQVTDGVDEGGIDPSINLAFKLEPLYEFVGFAWRKNARIYRGKVFIPTGNYIIPDGELIIGELLLDEQKIVLGGFGVQHVVEKKGGQVETEKLVASFLGIKFDFTTKQGETKLTIIPPVTSSSAEIAMGIGVKVDLALKLPIDDLDKSLPKQEK